MGALTAPLSYPHVRQAKPSDIMRIGIICCAGFRYSPIFRWERPHHEEYPEDTLLSYRKIFADAIGNENSIVYVALDKYNPNENDYTTAKFPSQNDWNPPEKDTLIPVAIAWIKMPPGSPPADNNTCDQDKCLILPENEGRDLDRSHYDSWARASAAAKRKHLRGHYILEMLVTHPAYWKRGHATSLIEHSIEYTSMGAKLGVNAAGMGQSLYISLGFKEISHVKDGKGASDGVRTTIYAFDPKLRMSHSVPDGFPARVSDEMVWTGTTFTKDPDQYILILSEDDVQSISLALGHFKGLNISRGLADPSTFPLTAELAERLGSISETLSSGRGFVVLRGLEPIKYTEEEKVIIFAGLTSYVATKRECSISHIRNRAHVNPHGDTLRPLELSCSMEFHTDVDNGNIVSMFTQSLPLQGGEQYLASVGTIYNTLVEKDAEVIKTLSQNWYWERNWRPTFNVNAIKTFNRPVLAYENGKLQLNFAAAFVGCNPAFPMSPRAPEVSAAQKHAAKAILEIANETKLKVSQQVGDLLFFNNYGILHGRGEWVDSEVEPQQRRYLMRLIHHDDKGWASAKALQRDMSDKWGVAPQHHNLMTGSEWEQLPRSCRVKQLGVTATDDHD
ncbi:Taurine hydroxylase-like protein SAT17 [Paramyrothecium foliicola]|nr:Taurine hydroxylase-like protein SAT17 [Paramyrothecium foliicola]